MEKIKCLNCEDKEMDKYQCGKNLYLEHCRYCGGIWLDRGELHDLKELGEFYVKNLDSAVLQAAFKNRIRDCPRCQVVLEPVFSKTNKNIKIDKCPDCKGIWLDRGELSAVIRLL